LDPFFSPISLGDNQNTPIFYDGVKLSHIPGRVGEKIVETSLGKRMTKWVATGALAAAMSFSLPKLEPFGQLNHVIGKQDKASLGKKQDRVGGINLSDENLTLNIKDDGAGMPLPVQF